MSTEVRVGDKFLVTESRMLVIAVVEDIVIYKDENSGINYSVRKPEGRLPHGWRRYEPRFEVGKFYLDSNGNKYECIKASDIRGLLVREHAFNHGEFVVSQPLHELATGQGWEEVK